MNHFEIKKAVAGGVAGAYYGEASANAEVEASYRVHYDPWRAHRLNLSQRNI